MNKIKISFGSLFEVGQGALVALTPEQAAPRRHRLEALSDGVYRVRENIQFKGGEEIGIEGDVPKGQAASVEVIGGEADTESTTPKRGPSRGGKR